MYQRDNLLFRLSVLKIHVEMKSIYTILLSVLKVTDVEDDLETHGLCICNGYTWVSNTFIYITLTKYCGDNSNGKWIILDSNDNLLEVCCDEVWYACGNC